MKTGIKLAVICFSILIFSSSFVNTNRKINIKLGRVITGTVIYSSIHPTDPSAEIFAIPGVSIVAYEGNTPLINFVAMTDIDGNYEITLPLNATKLRYSFVGLMPVDITLTSKSVEDVIMYSDID